MLIFERLIEWVWILTGIGLFAVLAYLAYILLHLKNIAMGSFQRLSQPPLNASKNLLTTVKGIVQQEKIHVVHILHTVKDTVGYVKDAATEIGTVARTIHPDELKAATAQVRQTVGLVSATVHIFRSLSNLSKRKSTAGASH